MVQILKYDGTMDTVEQKVIVDGEEQVQEVEVPHFDVFKELESEDEQKLLRRAKIRADVLNTRGDGQYRARIKPEEVSS